MTAQQKRGIKLLIVTGLIAAAIWRIESVSTQKLMTRYTIPVHPLAMAPTPSAANDGNRLAHVNGCFNCHGDQLTGRAVFTGWFGTRIVAPNLTRLARKETDAQLAASIRYGVRPDSTSLIDMPSDEFIRSSDSDIAAIIAYLHILQEKPDTAGKTRWNFGGRAMLAVGLLPLEAEMVDKSARGPLQTPTSPIALGQYITQSHCSICHGPDLSGDTTESSPDLRISIKHYSLAAFEHFFRTGQGQIGHGTRTMTKVIRDQFRYLTAADLDAIYVYLKADDRSG
jgi:cytochrome c553